MDPRGGRHALNQPSYDAQVIAYHVVKRLADRERRRRSFRLLFSLDAALAIAAIAFVGYRLIVGEPSPPGDLFFATVGVVAGTLGALLGGYAASHTRRRQRDLLRNVVLLEKDELHAQEQARRSDPERYEQLAL